MSGGESVDSRPPDPQSCAPMRAEITFYLNGKLHHVADEKAGWMLADYLRYDLGLTGTKIVCAEGDCGACTVLRYFPWVADEFLPVNSCILTVAQMDGSSLVTVDAISKEGTSPDALSPVQRAMMTCHGSQCGFCTPGFVMALQGLVEKRLSEKKLSPIQDQEAKNCLTGNLCRCTGYSPIIEAARSLRLPECESVEKRYRTSGQDRDLKKARAQEVLIETESFSFYAPKTLSKAFQYLRRHKDVRILAAGSDLGVVHNKRKIRLVRTMSLHLIEELYEVGMARGKIRVGARVTLSELRSKLKKAVPEFSRFLDLFASPQIKNVATLVGNVCNASPIADTPPFLLAANAVVHVVGPGGKRRIPLDRFYLGYRKIALKAGEFAYAIEFDQPSSSEALSLYKVSQRKDLDISTVNAAFRIKWKASPSGKKIGDIRIALGGMAATPLRLKKMEKALLGQSLDPASLKRAIQVFHAEMAPISDLRGSAAFRRVSAENLIHRFFEEQAEARRS